MTTDDLSHAERARLRRETQAERSAAWLAEQQEDDGVYIPPVWTPEYVAVRLVECAEVVSRLPPERGPRGPQSSGRNYFHTPEEAKELREATITENLAPRRERPSAVELARMDQVIQWPMRFLSNDTEIAAVISNWSTWKALDRDVDVMIDRYFYASRRRFYAKRKEGLAKLAKALNDHREAVT